MVHRQLTYRPLISGVLGLVAAFLLAGLWAAPASADNTRVTITDFAWSQEPTVNLGESVTWDWIGPDLQHSVTGQAPNASQWDSHVGIASPLAKLGQSYTVTFDEPGQYLFLCKLHQQTVRGVVTVTDQPGDPNSDPGPQAPLKFDLEPPLVESVRLARTEIGPHGKGTALNFEVGERGTASIDYYRIVTRGKGRNKRHARVFAGYHESEVHIGINSIRFAHRSPTFKPRTGKYFARFRVDDETSNESPEFPLRFRIKPSKAELKKAAQRKAAAKRKAAKKRAAKRKAAKKRAAKKKAKQARRS